MIFCKSKKSAQRTLENIIPFIERKLFLKVNRKKTGVAHISKVKYLGYCFYRYKGKCRFRVHPKSVTKMKSIHCRYGDAYPLWTKVHITSIFPPEEIYRQMVKEENRANDSFKQLLRRITKITYHFITISTVFAGFSFTALGLLLGLSSEKLIERIKNTSIITNKVNRIY